MTVAVSVFLLFFPLVGNHCLCQTRNPSNIKKQKKHLGLLISRAKSVGENINKFKLFRNIYNETIRAAKKLYYEKQFSKFQSNLKKSWQLLYSAIDKKVKSS